MATKRRQSEDFLLPTVVFVVVVIMISGTLQ
jgi:hypothetical protein